MISVIVFEQLDSWWHIFLIVYLRLHSAISMTGEVKVGVRVGADVGTECWV